MAVEQLSEHIYDLTPGPFDVHAHPRVFDTLSDDNFATINEGTEGKAGLRIYTEAALRSGITGIAAMPNESVRLYDATNPEMTEEIPYPIADRSRVLAMHAAAAERAVIPTAVYMGLDPAETFWEMEGEPRRRLKAPELENRFRSVSDDCIGLKVYLAETTGGNNIAVEYGAEVARLWHTANPEKPVVFHVEGADTARLLNNIGNLQGSPDATGGRMNIGRNIPVHIAHVSSRQEMQAVIDAKQAGLNVTCEVTPHHLFLNESIPEEIGGYGCMKPNLKSQADVDFLWTHMGDIDIFASDCAPHRISDKEKDQPAFGVTNHTIMLPLLLGAVADDRLSMADIDRKFCVTPRERFNLPLDDGSLLSISTDPSTYQLTATERDERAEYGQNPFTLLEGRFRMLGRIVAAQAGRSIVMADHGSDLLVGYMKTSYTHQLRPKNFQTGQAE